jgi:hypothetical protein
VGRLDEACLSRGDVVAVKLTPGAGWLDLVREIWDPGAALLPLDPRLPPTGSDALIRAARPTVVLDTDGWRRLTDGVPASADVALIAHTSGTGGAPKLAQFDLASIEAAVAASAPS